MRKQRGDFTHLLPIRVRLWLEPLLLLHRVLLQELLLLLSPGLGQGGLLELLLVKNPLLLLRWLLLLVTEHRDRGGEVWGAELLDPRDYLLLLLLIARLRRLDLVQLRWEREPRARGFRIDT